MKANEIVSDDARPVETDDLFETANLFPRTTGLPMTVWVSPRGNARRDVRIKGEYEPRRSDEPGKHGVRPSPRVIAGRLSPDDRQAVFEWVSLNTAPLVAYCEGQIDTIELGRLLQPLPAGRPGAPSV